MWTRSELKSRAKYNLGRYYWTALLVCFITVLLGGGNGGTTAGSTGSSINNVSEQGYHGEFSEAAYTVMAIVGVVILVFAIILFLLTIFVGGPVQVGQKRFFMESRDMEVGNAGVGRIFYSFSGGRYWNTVKVMLLRNVFIFLWSLLFVVPGIIKAYEYCMVPYILSENPDIHYKDALNLSKQMMYGQKMNVFVLEISFIGWELLGAMACGIGIYFVLPYIEATMAELYALLRTTVPGDQLPGFGIIEEYVEQEPTDYYY